MKEVTLRLLMITFLGNKYCILAHSINVKRMRREELMRDVCWSDDDETCTARGNIEGANMEKNREKV